MIMCRWCNGDIRGFKITRSWCDWSHYYLWQRLHHSRHSKRLAFGILNNLYTFLLYGSHYEMELHKSIFLFSFGSTTSWRLLVGLIFLWLKEHIKPSWYVLCPLYVYSVLCVWDSTTYLCALYNIWSFLLYRMAQNFELLTSFMGKMGLATKTSYHLTESPLSNLHLSS